MGQLKCVNANSRCRIRTTISTLFGECKVIAKKNISFNGRSSGILLHISSLPGPYGIGDLGQGAFDFIDFLVAAGQRYWQFLPLGPVSDAFGCSPYMGVSAMAGNPLFVSPVSLVDDGFLTWDVLHAGDGFSEYRADFANVIKFKSLVLEKAFVHFNERGHEDFPKFCDNESYWLDDYALFMAIREHQNKSWDQWPKDIVARKPEMLKAVSESLSQRVLYYKFEQFIFFRQWRRLAAYASKCGVQLIGDLPIYVSYDSVDVWANQSCFHLDRKTSQPTYVAGVPPDYFSETGQRWGNPLYLWKDGRRKNDTLYRWWRQRFKHLAQMVDAIRIDHFRGFESYWQIPAKELTAVKGRWVKGPGRQFFVDMGRDIKGISIIAEDLGIITADVRKLRDDLGFPGMKILQFAFDSDENNLYLPHNFETTNCIVYTGTHDNDTTVGWYLGANIGAASKERVRKYANSDGATIHRDFIRFALSSTASTAILPLQDILGFGSDCRMNTPGTTENNWQWRCASRFLNTEIGNWLREETRFYGRISGKD
nr:4-alpha-glucanotransferase [Desulfobulbaceae bacterium]